MSAAGVEQHRRTFDVAAGRIGHVTHKVKQRLVLPVHQIRIHAALQERAKHAGVVQEIALASGDDRRDAKARVEQLREKIGAIRSRQSS